MYRSSSDMSIPTCVEEEAFRVLKIPRGDEEEKRAGGTVEDVDTTLEDIIWCL